MRTPTAALILAAVALTACGDDDSSITTTDDTEPSADDGIDAETMDFEGDGDARAHRGGAISDEPIDPRLALGTDFQRDHDGDWQEGTPGLAYVAVSGHTGCQLPTDAELHRVGDDLQVTFTGGEVDDDVTCVRPYEPYVQFLVDAEAVRDVETIQGENLLAPDGPGELVELIEFDTAEADDFTATSPTGAETGSAEALAMYDPSGARDNEVQAALEHEPPDGARSFVFLLAECPGRSDAGLILTHDRIDATMHTDPLADACEVSVDYLAVLEVDEELVPETAEP